MSALELPMDEPIPRRDARPFGPGFRAFYERHFRFVYRVVARQCRHSADIDDLVQEIFSIAGHKLAEFEGRAKETTWLFRIASNVVNAHRRKQQRQHLLSMRWLQPASESSVVETPDREVERNEAQELVREILAEMSEKKRDVFILFELEGLPGQEVAEIVGCPLDTMWTRLFHARRDFRKRLEDRGIRSFADLSALPGGSR